MLENATGPLFKADRARARETTGNSAETLRQENQRLKNLLITVATIILKSIVETNHRDGGNPSLLESACLFEKAEECFLAARANVGLDAAKNLEAAGRALLATAMELKASAGHKPAGNGEFPLRIGEH